MDNKKYLSKFRKLFKTKKALDLFMEEYADKIDTRVEIIKYYRPKTGKNIQMVNRTDLADRVHSEYTRLKDVDENGMCVCVTCLTKDSREKMQEGHYRTRGHYPTRYDDRNTHPQCYRCNVVYNGNYRNYHIYMVKTYGEEVENFLRTDKTISDYNQGRYEEHILERYEFITEKKAMIKKV